MLTALHFHILSDAVKATYYFFFYKQHHSSMVFVFLLFFLLKVYVSYPFSCILVRKEKKSNARNIKLKPIVCFHLGCPFNTTQTKWPISYMSDLDLLFYSKPYPFLEPFYSIMNNISIETCMTSLFTWQPLSCTNGSGNASLFRGHMMYQNML